MKRIRNDYCEGSLRDTLNRFVPQPAGPRRAHIRVPEPLGLHDFAGSEDEALELLRARMQAALDAINAALAADGACRTYPNPFHRPQFASPEGRACALRMRCHQDIRFTIRRVAESERVVDAFGQSSDTSRSSVGDGMATDTMSAADTAYSLGVDPTAFRTRFVQPAWLGTRTRLRSSSSGPVRSKAARRRRR